MNKYDSALADYEKIDPSLKVSEDHDKKALFYARAKEFNKARAEADLYSLTGHDADQTLSDRIALLRNIGDDEGARLIADRALARGPNAHLYVLRARTRDDSDEAGRRADLEAAYSLDIKSYEAAADLAGLRLDAGDYPGALEAASRAATVTPEPTAPAAAMLLGRVHLKLGDRRSALSDFARAREGALAKGVTYAGLLNNLCWNEATENFDLAGALADCDASLKLKPQEGRTMDSRAFVLLRLGRYAESKAAYDQALALRPNAVSSLYCRSLAERRLGDFAAADQDEKAALAMNAAVAKLYAGYGVTR